MSIRCRLGIHRMVKRATHRKGTFVHRCARCGVVKVKHRRKNV